MTTALPAGWVRVQLHDLVDRLQYGYTAKAESEGNGPQFLRITDIEDGVVNWARVPHCSILSSDLPKYELAHGDLVFARTGSIEKACRLVNPPPAVFASYLIRGRPLLEATGPWVGVFLGSFAYRNQVSELSAGIGRANVNARKLSRVELELPPLPEQHRIVEAIESYSTRLDAAVATLERVQRNLKRYRASVLKAAVEGRLVPTEAELARAEGRSYEPASVLLERILAERRRRWEEAELAKMKARRKAPKDDRWKAKYVDPVSPDTSELPELPEGWRWVSIEQLSHLVRNGYSKKPASEGAVRILRISAVRPMNVDFEDSRWLPGSPQDYSRDLVQSGDLLFTRYNGSPALVGVSGLVRAVDRPTVHPDKLIKVRFLDALLDLIYLELATNTGASREFIERRTRTTAGQAGVSGGDVKQLPVPLPPYAEQRRVAEETERLISLAESSRETLSVTSLMATRLRQSILKRAFEGRLVNQDPTDESASALLQRIRAERESVSDKPARSPRRAKARTAKP